MIAGAGGAADAAEEVERSAVVVFKRVSEALIRNWPRRAGSSRRILTCEID